MDWNTDVISHQFMGRVCMPALFILLASLVETTGAFVLSRRSTEVRSSCAYTTSTSVFTHGVNQRHGCNFPRKVEKPHDTWRQWRCVRMERHFLLLSVKSSKRGKCTERRAESLDENDAHDDDIAWDAGALQDEIKRRNSEQDAKTSEMESASFNEADDGLPEFDGYAMRDIILEKFGRCFDLDFRRIESMGQRTVYLNVMPFHLGSRRFRHRTEFDYLCHLQAIVEILVKYDRLDYILAQIAETNKKPRAGTSPLVAVPLRLDLPQHQVDKILDG